MRLPRRHSTFELDRLIASLLGSEPESAIETIEREACWDRVVDRACQTQCAGFLGERLARIGHALPDSAARQIGVGCEHVAADNARKVECVAPVVAALNNAKIPFLVLKGLALNSFLYPSYSMRPMTDVDVLIRPEDTLRTNLVLAAECGCKPGDALVQDDFYPKFHYEREYLTPHVPPVKIDLHARPFRPLRYARTMPGDAMWEGGEITLRIGGVPITIPNRENMLIHLCVHAACHGLDELRWMHDIKVWIERFEDTLNWDAIVTRCARWRLCHPMRTALQRTSATFEMVARPMLDAAAAMEHHENALDRLALWQAPHGRSRPVTDVLVNALCSPGVAFRASYLCAALLPSHEHLGQIYRRRHPGWIATAHAYRAIRCLARPFVQTGDTAA